MADGSGDGIDKCTEADSLADAHRALLATGATVNGLPILVPIMAICPDTDLAA